MANSERLELIKIAAKKMQREIRRERQARDQQDNRELQELGLNMTMSDIDRRALTLGEVLNYE